MHVASAYQLNGAEILASLGLRCAPPHCGAYAPLAQRTLGVPLISRTVSLLTNTKDLDLLLMIGQCRLCMKRDDLSFSHILPEFLYGKVYDSKHRTYAVQIKRPDRPITLQKGVREYLLCPDCEEHFSRFETYAARIMRKIAQLNFPSLGIPFASLSVDYSLFKLFQMSLLWRASVSSHPMFSRVDVGGREEQLRQMLHLSRPGKRHNFGCIMLLLPGTIHLERVILAPSDYSLDSRSGFCFITGQIFWLYFIGSFPKSHNARSMFLSEDGELTIYLAPWSENQVLNNLSSLIQGA